MPKIAIVPHSKRKHQQPQWERKNVFSDETNLFLLGLLRGKSDLPHTLTDVTAPARDLQHELATAIRQRVLPWFWSVSFHTALLILLAFILLPGIRLEPLDILSGIVTLPLPQEALLNVPPGNVGDAASPIAENTLPTQTTENVTRPSTPAHSSPPLTLGNGGGEGGGGGEPDEAVLAGLRWLVKVQQPNGAWHLSGTFSQSAPKRLDDPLAATAMALLAFQGYGITSHSRSPLLSEFARPVRRGWDWLRQQQNPDGSFFSPQTHSKNHRFYTHGLCTIALCELLAMTGDESLREPAQQAIDYCIQHQSIRRGGWRYLPDRFSEQSDVSVTGWIVLALKNGQAAGLNIPPETYTNITHFLDTMTVGNQYRYREEEPEPSIAMTAEALLCRILLGWKRDDRRLAVGVQLLLDAPPTFTDHYKRNVYYWFFASQTLYHYGGNEWQTWNSTMRQELLRQQEQYGNEAGSWNPQPGPNRPARDQWGTQYGRLYTTCMSLYILETSYRHQPIFSEEN